MITERALNIKDLIVDKPEEGLFAYHRSTMTSPEILELEKQKIFQKCWLYLGHESEVTKPGDFVRRDLAGQPLFFVRSRQTGKINVFLASSVEEMPMRVTPDSGDEQSRIVS